MISFLDAIDIIKKRVKKNKKSEKIKTEYAISRIPIKNYYSKNSYPEFDNSAMDGVVINENDYCLDQTYKIVDEIKAGDKKSAELKKNESKFIFTGAPIPGKNKKLIIPIEELQFIEKEIFKISKHYIPRNFIRQKSSDIKIGQKIISKNKIMNLRDTLLALRANQKYIDVIKKINISVIISGDEIINKNNPKGFIPSTNSKVLETFINLFDGNLIEIKYVKDNKEEIKKVIEKLSNHDLLITSGGISKGRYDLIKESLLEMNLKILFQGVAIKPGKPTTFGIFKDGTYFLGLPGNPISCFVTSIFFVNEIINSFYGNRKNLFVEKKIKSCANFLNNTKLTLFLRIKLIRTKNQLSFLPIENQDSSLNSELSRADGILVLNSSEKVFKNKMYKVYLFDRLNLNYI